TKKFKSDARYSTRNESITGKIQFKRCQYTTKTSTRDDGVISETWGKPVRGMFADFSTNAHFNGYVSCDYENRCDWRAYFSLVPVRFSRPLFYFTNICCRGDIFTTKIDDGRKFGSR